MEYFDKVVEEHPRVMVSIPAHTPLPPALEQKHFELVFNPTNCIAEIHFDSELKKRVNHKREDAADYFMASRREKGFTHICYADSDVVPTFDAIERLLTYQKAFVGAMIFQKIDRHLPTFGYWDQDRYYTPLPIPYNVLMPVDVIGMGFNLIHYSVFERLEKPYFKAWKPGGWSGRADLYFSVQCRNAGIPIYVDTGLCLAHANFDVHYVTNEDYEQSLLYELIRQFQREGKDAEFWAYCIQLLGRTPDQKEVMDQPSPFRRIQYHDTHRLDAQ